jgi:hypothetical protein
MKTRIMYALSMIIGVITIGQNAVAYTPKTADINI